MNKNNTLVSIIVPIYNVDKFLAECLQSILNQSHDKLDIILVDDGSTDKSGLICDEFAKKDNRIRVFHTNNNGVSSAKNLGIKNSNGEYICFVDADDYMLPNHVEYILSIIRDCDVAFSYKYLSDYNKQAKDNKNEVRIISGEQAAIDLLYYKINIGVWNKMFKKTFLHKYNVLFYANQFMGEGFNFNMKAFQYAEKVSAGFSATYFYRRDNENSATTKFSLEKWNNAFESIDKIKEDLIIKTQKMMVAWEFANWRTHSDAFDLLVLSGQYKFYKEKYKEIKSIVRKGWYKAYKSEAPKNEKIRALLFGFNVRIVPFLIKIKRIIFGVKVKN